VGSPLEKCHICMISSILEQIPLSVRQLLAMALFMHFHDIHSPENAGQLGLIVEEVVLFM